MADLTLAGYLGELFDLRDKLRDFVARVGEGKTSYYKEIAIKLRILLCQKSRTEPLLSAVERQLGMQVVVAVRYSVQERIDKGLLPASSGEGLVFEQINSVATWFEQGHEIVPILAALERKEILIEGERHSYREVIEVAADKMGGAHVDRKVKDHDLVLHSESLLIGGLPVAQRALFDTARACITLVDAIEDATANRKQFPFLRDARKQEAMRQSNKAAAADREARNLKGKGGQVASEPVVSELITKECAERFHIRPAYVIEAANAPDQTDELEQEGLRLRIHSKRIEKARPAYSLLVIERFSEGKRNLDFALKLYQDLVEGVGEFSPTHQLEALAGRFGFEIAIGAQRSRFFWAAKIPISSQGDIRLAQGTNPHNHSMIQQMYVKVNLGPPMVANCALCFCLDVTTYGEWLQQHRR